MVTLRKAALLVSAVWCLAAQPGRRPAYAVFSPVDGSSQPYSLYLPRQFDASKKYPLILSLHSEDSDDRLNLSQVLGSTVTNRSATTNYLGTVTAPPPRDIGYIVACPLARGTMGYQGIAEEDVYDVLADVKRRYPVDEDRIYLTGVSMGGGGALWMAMTRPDVWAGVAALCPDAPPGSEEFAANLLNVPVRLYHGESDPVLSPASSRLWQARLLDLGIPAAYYEYPAVRHNVWDVAYAPGAALDWFDGLRRVHTPDHVHFVTRAYQYRSAYWVRIDGLTPGLAATIDARRSGAEIQVTTQDVDAFTLLLPPAQLPKQIRIDGADVALRPAAVPSFVKTSAGWRIGVVQPQGKGPGSEGPIAAAVSSRHIYVYGTLGTHSADELEIRKKQAQDAAAWSTTRSRLLLKLPVKADTEVTPADVEDSDLVLFGSAQSNLVVEQLSTKLPMALRPDAADYGLLFIASVGRHYVLVSSGLSWWPSGDGVSTAGYALAPPQYRQLAAYGDYVLFRGSPAHIVAEGRFDRNWNLSPDAAAKLTATGTVTLR